MSAAKSKAKLGELVEVKEGGVVMSPDGVERTVSGGSYVLDQVGTFTVDGAEVEVK